MLYSWDISDEVVCSCKSGGGYEAADGGRCQWRDSRGCFFEGKGPCHLFVGDGDGECRSCRSNHTFIYVFVARIFGKYPAKNKHLMQNNTILLYVHTAYFIESE